MSGVQAPVIQVASTLDGTESCVGVQSGKVRLLPIGSIGPRNLLLNGDFNSWQAATSQTTSGYGSDDQWKNFHNGSTKTVTQQAFDVSQVTVPGNPRYFSRTVVASVAGNGNYVNKSQYTEDVTLLAGKTCTLSFWAKADAPKNIAISFSQIFGSGGSVAVTGIGAQTVALTADWKFYTCVVTFPSLTGKVLGSAVSSCTVVEFWFDAGSDYNARTANLGQQSGTFDLAMAMFNKGSSAAPFNLRGVDRRHENTLIKSYFEIITAGSNGPIAVCQATSATNATGVLSFLTKRSAPSLSTSGNFGIQSASGSTIPVTGINFGYSTPSTASFAAATASGLVAGNAAYLFANNDANAYFALDARL